mmetsp:Transcript_30680/g.77553  ORF Transcript_30680/g.77553 Transcript_30680/m.77553 type:complete len:249 (+) Transcript_30680:115-861(+)
MAQWSVKCKIEDSTVAVQIEPHATVNMLKQRVAMIAKAHCKHQKITNEAGLELDDVKKLEDCDGLCDGATVIVHVDAPKEEDAPVVEELSDDEEKWGEEEEGCEPLPEGEEMTRQLADDEQDRQNALKGAAAELLEDGDKKAALGKLTEAIMIGAPSAMMISKRAELLLKLKRAKGAAADATAALAINPDSGKAFRVRGKARRYLGDYVGAKSDLDQAQNIDYDDSVADVHAYVKKRVAKMAALQGSS